MTDPAGDVLPAADAPPAADPPPDAELTPTDVFNYTGGRLAADDPETQRMLDAALTAARNDVEWHVSPVRTNQTLVLNGPWYSRKLRLPTKRIVQLNSVLNDGTPLDLTNDVIADPEVGWLVHRRRGNWSHKIAGIEINFDHGFTAVEASDWRQAILSMVDQMVTIIATGRPDSDLQSKQVDDVVYRWGAAQALPGAESILQYYRLCFGVA